MCRGLVYLFQSVFQRICLNWIIKCNLNEKITLFRAAWNLIVFVVVSAWLVSKFPIWSWTLTTIDVRLRRLFILNLRLDVHSIWVSMIIRARSIWAFRLVLFELWGSFYLTFQTRQIWSSPFSHFKLHQFQVIWSVCVLIRYSIIYKYSISRWSTLTRPYSALSRSLP